MTDWKDKPCKIHHARLGKHGYPMIGSRPAYRVLWVMKHGEPDDYMVLHHKCENKLCVELSHLELMTMSQHSTLHAKQRGGPSDRVATCYAGHDMGNPDNIIVVGSRRRCKHCHEQMETIRAHHNRVKNVTPP